MELEEIPGVGEKTVEALEHLDDPLDALQSGDVATVANAPGIGDGRAARLSRNAIRQRHGETGEFLATDRAEEVYESLLELVKQRTVTDYGERRVETLYPSSRESRIEEVREIVSEALEREFSEGVQTALERLEPLSKASDTRIRDRCLVTGDAEQYSAARDEFDALDVELIDSKRELNELVRDYSTVVVIDERYEGLEGEGVHMMPDALDRPLEVAPERVLSFFATNKREIVAALDAHESAGIDTPVDENHLREALSHIDDTGAIVGDGEVVRLTKAIDGLDSAVDEAEELANGKMEDAIKEEEVTIQGGNLLSLAEQGGDINSVISETLAEEYEKAIDTAKSHFIDALELASGESTIADELFPRTPAYPVRREPETVTRLRDELRKKRDRLEIRRKREVAAELVEMKDEVEHLVAQALELDVERALSLFAADYDCTLPIREGEGFTIEGGMNPLLDVDFHDVEPVDYGIEGVALLSGVNSGGKTSTLDLIATITILAHMGLPVPASHARVPEVEEIHYYAKASGTLDAGAFESTLREFGEIATGTAGQLVLVDELESITEPGASAKIVAGVLEALHTGTATAVVVSHLADKIQAECRFDVTVDGIRAHGLVNGELQVDRSPVKNHLARSTPELIVEKLAGEEDKQFYGELLRKFDNDSDPVQGRSGAD